MLFKALLDTNKSDLLVILIIVIVFDFLTGNLKAWKWKVTDSAVGYKGIIKHTTTFMLYYIIIFIGYYLKISNLTNYLIYMVYLNYAYSILENLAVMGVYIPNFLKAKVKAELKRYEDKLKDTDN